MEKFCRDKTNLHLLDIRQILLHYQFQVDLVDPPHEEDRDEEAGADGLHDHHDNLLVALVDPPREEDHDEEAGPDGLHDYHDDIVAQEERGPPAVVDDVQLVPND